MGCRRSIINLLVVVLGVHIPAGFLLFLGLSPYSRPTRRHKLHHKLHIRLRLVLLLLVLPPPPPSPFGDSFDPYVDATCGLPIDTPLR